VTDAILPAVRQFIVDHIRSVETLEVLMLLHADPARQWTPDEVGREARTNEWAAQMQLEALSARGLIRLVGNDPTRFEAEPAVSSMVIALARVFRERRVAVIRQIYTRRHDDSTE